MATEHYNLIFRGELLEGHAVGAVQKKLAGLLKMDAARVAKLFEGKPMTLKRGVDRATAAKYQKAFKSVGAKLRVMASEGRGAAASQATPNEVKPAPRSAGAKKSLAERLVAKQAGAGPASTPSAAFGPAWDLAPAGSDLVRPEERPRELPVDVPDVSHISAMPANSGSLAEVVVKEEPPPPPDVSGISVADVGVDLTDPTEAAPVHVPDTSDITIAEVGVTLVKPKEVIPVEVDTSAISVAEAGSDLADPTADEAPPAPNTDHIELDQTP